MSTKKGIDVFRTNLSKPLNHSKRFCTIGWKIIEVCTFSMKSNVFINVYLLDIFSLRIKGQ